jgi:NitT/TauT family transport system substrate-binding protein
MEKKGAQRIFDSRSMPGRVVDVLAVRADALPIYAASLRHALDCHFTALQQMQEFASRSAELLARRLQTPAGEVMGLYRGLRQPDRAQNRTMLAAGGMVDLTAQKLQTVMVEAGLLQPALVLQALVEPRFLFP